MSTRRLVLAACLLLISISAGRVVSAEAAPQLVVLLSVDQLRRDRLDPSLPGGLGRIAREGQVHLEALVDHALTDTCSGHVAMVTGRHPGAAGVPGNRFIDRATSARTYCVEDSPDVAGVIGDTVGRSPRNLRVDGLGDWIRAAHPESKVFSVSPKDRSAVVLGGRHPDAAYWMILAEHIGFTTSRYYLDALPQWVRDWNRSDPQGDGFLASLPNTWDHEVSSGWHGDREDAYEFESDQFGRTSGHRLRDTDRETFADAVYHSPYLDDLTLDFALELARREGLGRDAAPDLLAISLSATDRIGHLYGPESHEARDGLVRLDAALGRFLTEIEGLAPGRWVVALSSDHGVLPIPEWLSETGRSECPIPGGRRGITRLGLGLLWKLHWELAPLLSIPRRWVHITGTQVTVDRSLAAERGKSVEEVTAVAKGYLEQFDAVERVWTEREILEGDGELARLYRNSFDPERSGDLTVQLRPTCLVTGFDVGTSHGSPYLYDREVPVAFLGPGIAAREISGSASTVDVAPSLAGWIGLEAPEGLDGHALLPLRFGGE